VECAADHPSEGGGDGGGRGVKGEGVGGGGGGAVSARRKEAHSLDSSTHRAQEQQGCLLEPKIACGGAEDTVHEESASIDE
jgi:hypothetical protein